MTIRKGVVVFLLVIMTVVVESRILQNIYSESAELRQLSKQQAEFERQFELIRNDLGRASNMFKTTESRPKRIEAMEKTIERHRGMLLEASKNLIPPLNLSLCSCQALSTEQKQHIINELNEVRSSIFTLRDALAKATPCTRTRQMQEDLQAQLFIADTIEEVLDSKCRKAALLSPTIWQTNLNAPNWILGDQTLDDLVDDYYDRSVHYENVTNCHISEPYYNGKSCISCPADLPLFNMYTQQCTKCDPGLQYNSKLKNCVEEGTPLQTRPTCRADQFLVEKNNTCVELVKCGPGTTLDRETNTCRIKRCQVGKTLNQKTGQCEKLDCGSDFYNPDTFQCEKYRTCADSFLNRQHNVCEPWMYCNPESQFLDRVRNVCVSLAACAIDQFLDRKTNQCVERVKCDDSHYYNDKLNTCELRAQCSGNEFYDMRRNLCVPFVDCPGKWLNRQTNVCENLKQCDGKQTILNPKTNQCEKPKDCGSEQFFNRDTFECQAFTQCPADQFLNRHFNRCEPFRTCPTNYLDKTKNECVEWKKCEGEFLNRLTNECQPIATCVGKAYNPRNNTCEDYVNCEGAFLNRLTNTCEKFVVCEGKFLNRENNVCEEKAQCNPQVEWYNATTNRCQPYVECNKFLDRTINACLDFVQCSDKEELDRNTNKCVEKVLECHPDEVLNTDSGKCVKRPVIYRPASQLSNYVEGNTTLSMYLTNVQGDIDRNPNAKVAVCPDTQPFSLISECTSCPGGLFFLDSMSCGNCKDGYQYDIKLKSCRIKLYLSHPTAKLDLHGLSSDEFAAFEQKIVSRNPNALVSSCPQNKPFSVEGARCVSCPASSPIFDIMQSECKSCSAEQQYDESKRSCV